MSLNVSNNGIGEKLNCLSWYYTAEIFKYEYEIFNNDLKLIKKCSTCLNSIKLYVIFSRLAQRTLGNGYRKPWKCADEQNILIIINVPLFNYQSNLLNAS